MYVSKTLRTATTAAGQGQRQDVKQRLMLLQGDGQEEQGDWGKSCTRAMRHRFQKRLDQPPDGHRPTQAPTRKNVPQSTDSEDWMAVMVTDCGYERVPRHDFW